MKKVEDMLAEAKPDVAVVISNPHGILPDDTMAVFGVCRGETLSTRSGQPSEARQDPRMQRYSGGAQPHRDGPAREPKSFKGYPPLAEHLIDSLIDQGFDVASQLELRPELGMDEAFDCFYCAPRLPRLGTAGQVAQNARRSAIRLIDPQNGPLTAA